MIRAFTISFDFNGKTYLALATMTQRENEEPVFSIRLYDDSLVRVVPDGCVQYSAKETKQDGELQHPQASRLLRSIRESVAAHLKSIQV